MEIKFGTDGWRGVMGGDFTYESVRKVGQAIADYLKSKPPKTRAKHSVIVGFDCRFQSEAFAEEIARVMEANGHSAVLSAEPLPTPAVSYLTRKLKAVGVVVTASHNPPSYNGVKIKIEGRTAPDSMTAEAEAFLDRANPARGAKPAAKSFKKDYLEYLRSRIDPSGFIAKLSGPVVVDSMHGTSGGLMSELTRGNKRIIEMNAERDPLFGGISP
ncbi:MAG: phosphoglucomutase/phosphomannomutase family protein, partial [candidate division NC10 bacterium]